MRNRSPLLMVAVPLGIGIALLGPLAAASADTGTFSDAPDATPIVVEDQTTTRTIPVDLEGDITDVDVTLDFRKVGDWCSNPSGFLAWNNEIAFDLVSPSGTRVALIHSGHLSDDPDDTDPDITYPSPWESEHVRVTLDDQAAVQVGTPERQDPNDRYPEEGTFRTAGKVLDGLNGEPAAGEWQLEVTNESWGDQLCYFGASLAITTAPPATPPALTGEPTAAARIGESFTYTPAFTPGTPNSTVELAPDSALPDGLELDPATGAITGIPSGSLEDYPIVLTSDNGVPPAARLPVTITLSAGKIHALAITPTTPSIDEGGSIKFTATATDIEGNPVDTTGDEIVFSSSVTSDTVDGDRLTFPKSAPPHVVTATHTLSGLSVSTTVRVIPAVAPTPTPPHSPDVQPELARTGLDTNWSALLAGGSVLLLLGGAMILGSARWAHGQPRGSVTE